MLAEEWKTQSLGDVLTLEYGASLTQATRTGEGYPVVGSSGVVGRHRDFLVSGPGIVVGRKGTVGAAVWCDTAFWPIDTTYYVVPNKSADLRWLFWFLGWLPLNRLDSSTGVPGLNRHDAYSVEIQVPPVVEQRRIAEILDTADEAIRVTERVIAKLKMMKQGLLHDLLTRGLDENGELRDPERRPELFRKSWLGQIPREWNVDLLGDACRSGGGSIQTGPFGSQLHASDYRDAGVPIITVEHLGDNEILHHNLPLVGGADYRRLARYILRTGDLVFSRVGAIDRCAHVSEREDGWLFSGRCLRVRAGDGVLNSKFLSYQLNGYMCRRWVLNHSVGSTMPSLNTAILEGTPVLVPTVGEQAAIASRLDSLASRVRAEEVALEKLRQVKRGLMDDLLTGRVRVGGLGKT